MLGLLFYLNLCAGVSIMLFSGREDSIYSAFGFYIVSAVWLAARLVVDEIKKELRK